MCTQPLLLYDPLLFLLFYFNHMMQYKTQSYHYHTLCISLYWYYSLHHSFGNKIAPLPSSHTMLHNYRLPPPPPPEIMSQIVWLISFYALLCYSKMECHTHVWTPLPCHAMSHFCINHGQSLTSAYIKEALMFHHKPPSPR